MKKIAYAVCAALTLSLVNIYTPAVSAAEEEKLIALTFDDGPNTTTTNQVLDIMEKYDITGSFFLIGRCINEDSAVVVKRAYDMGCEINNHSKTHSDMSNMTEAEILEEIAYVDDYVREITGEGTKFFRPPFISTSQAMYDTISQPFISGLGCNDFMEDVTAEERAEAVISMAEDGLIVLLHDAVGNDQTVEALETIVPTLLEEGYEFVTLTELFERKGETPKSHMLYNKVTSYPCEEYAVQRNLYTGNASGDGSWSGWSDIAVLDGSELEQLGDTYAIEVACTGIHPPVIALQKWTDGVSLWHTVQPRYYNGARACFLAEDIQAALDANGVGYSDLDRMTIRPYGDILTMTQLDILVKEGAVDTRSGDVNSDGSISLLDAVLLQKYLVGIETLTEKQLKASDMDENTSVNVYDLAILKLTI